MPDRKPNYRVSGLVEMLGSANAAELLAVGMERRLPAHSVLFHEGDPGDRFVVLLEGRVKAVSWSVDGREILLNVQGPGESMGLPSAIDGGGRSASVVAIESVRYISITTEQFRAFVGSHPELAFVFMRDLVNSFRRTNRKQVEFGSLGTLGRVARQLAVLTEDFGDAIEDGYGIDLPLSHQDLANWTGSSREAVGKAMQQLERLGYVRAAGRKRIDVLNLEGLRVVGD